MSEATTAAAPGFQSTLPVWGATLSAAKTVSAAPISIHAPRVGSDSCAVEKPKPHCDFNPRSPCGERRCATSYNSMTMIFQSTLPVWGATWPCAIQRSWARFQSTLPVWGATCFRKRPRRCYTISIHAPRVGSDLFQQPHGVNLAISIHAPRVGSDLPRQRRIKLLCHISIHAPRVGSDSKIAQFFACNFAQK